MNFKNKLRLMILPTIFVFMIVILAINFLVTSFQMRDMQYELMRTRVEYIIETSNAGFIETKALGMEDVVYFNDATKRKVVEQIEALFIESDNIVIIDITTGDFVFSLNSEEDNFLISKEFLSEIQNELYSESDYSAETNLLNIKNKLGVYGFYNNWDWLIIETVDNSYVYRYILEAMFYSVIAVAFFFIIVFIIIYRFSYNIAKRLDNLGKGTIQIMEGDFDLNINIESKDEFGKLADSFNIMALEIKNRQAEIVKQKEHLAVTLRSIGDGVITTDVSGNITMINNEAENLTGWKVQEAIGQPLANVFNIVNEISNEKLENLIEDTIKKVIRTQNMQIMTNHILFIKKDKKEFWIESSAAPIVDEKNKFFGVVIVFRDITEKLEQIEKIEYLGLHDELTGLYNRRFYEEKMKKINMKRNLPISLIMGDLNGLKLINDSFGHAIGDQILIKAANAIKHGCRVNDLVARIGGDEFIIVLLNSDSQEAEEIIGFIQSKLKLEVVEGIELSISFGYCTKKDEKQSIQNLFKSAEDNMYKHKLHESNSMRSKTIDMISSTLFAKNEREQIHSKKVSELCEAISIKMGFNQEAVKRIKLAGLMHDIGKIGIEDKILNKNGKLNSQEYTLIKRHSDIGYRILSSLNDFAEIAEYVLEHHEKWDGSGYPKGLKGEEIKIEARIISVADAYAAMTNKRSYGQVLSSNDAIVEIKKCMGTHFDPIVATIFIEKVVQNI
jgi:diguanylate cyclase (GGDEF)-like protein/PAS domain S-box-containing protein/putative nucleotidyltransferase with HDIG domain